MQTNGWYSWKPHVVFVLQAGVDVSPENKTKHGVNIAFAQDVISIFRHSYNMLPSVGIPFLLWNGSVN